MTNYASMQCKYASMKVLQVGKYCKYASMQLLQVCKYESIANILVIRHEIYNPKFEQNLLIIH